MDLKMKLFCVSIFLGSVGTYLPISAQFELICKEGFKIHIEPLFIFFEGDFGFKFFCFKESQLKWTDLMEKCETLIALATLSLVLKFTVFIGFSLKFRPLGYFLCSLGFFSGFVIDILITFCGFNVTLNNLKGQVLVSKYFASLVWFPILLYGYNMQL